MSPESAKGLCRSTELAIEAAVDWVSDEKNNDVVGHERTSLTRALRLAQARTKRLERATGRPMCVGVFGPSQAGKSYLVEVLARPESGPLKARFEGCDPVDFLREINPIGEKESTGLVTRFTANPPTAPTPPGYPVRLRFLTELDVVKILGNSFLLDGDQTKEQPPTAEFLADQSTALRHKVGPRRSRLLDDDLLDLQEYFEKNFSGARLIEVLRPYWDTLKQVADCLPQQERAEAFSVLWGRHKDFTDLFTTLVRHIEALGDADEVYAPMAAIVPREGSILDVATLSGLAGQDGEHIEVCSSSGRTHKLPRQALAALTAELRIDLAAPPREFFQTTDLLDFPGARSRQKVDLRAFFELNAEALKETFLRGKVSYLFERYVAEQELTSMLLCVRPSNQEVATLPDLVDEWIASTHGRTPKSRTSQPNLLFLVLTWFDSHFIEKAGDAGNAAGARFAARLEASLLGFFGKAHGWPRRWTENQPFQNCFWFRNPNYPAESIIRYDGQIEREFIAEKLPRIQELKQGFLGLPESAAHFKDPARAFDEALRLNDGGISYLAEGLSQVCKPDLKLGQIAGQLAEVRAEVQTHLAKFYVAVDVEERLRSRRAAANRVFDELEAVVARNAFGSLLGEFLMDETELTDVIYAVLRSSTPKKSQQDHQQPAATQPQSSGRVIRPGVLRPAIDGQPQHPPEPAASAPALRPHDREKLIASACLDAWMTKLSRLAESTSVQNRFGVSAETLRQMVNEKFALVQRIDLEGALTQALKQILLVESAEALSTKAALVSAHFVNGIVGDLGFGQLPPPQRPEIDAGGSSRRAFAERSVVNHARGIGQAAKDFAATYATDWFFGFLRVVEDNVQNPHDLKVDLRMNAKLKEILDGLNEPARVG